MSDECRISVVYTPHADLGLGWRVWRQMAGSVWEARELTWQLFVRSWKARFRQSLLGYVWTLGTTLVTVGTFVGLQRARVIQFEGPIELPYPLFALIGVTVWQLFGDGLTRTTNSIVGVGNLIAKINFTRETVVLAAFGEALFDFCIRFALVLAVFPIFGTVPAWSFAALPLLLVPLLLLTLGVGIALAAANSMLRDFGSALPLLLPFAMFVTPVLYPPPTTWPWALLVLLNPVAPFVTAARDLAVGQAPADPLPLVVWSIASLVVCLAGWRFFHLAMPRVIERI